MIENTFPFGVGAVNFGIHLVNYAALVVCEREGQGVEEIELQRGKAVSEGFTRFSAIAIAGGVKGSAGKAYPCGVCRQVLREFCSPSDMKIYVVGSDDDVESFTLEELLPESFGPDFKSVK